MEMQGIEKELYLKWFEITKILITKKYGNEPYFTLNRINKLAQENSRYFLSVYTPTNLAYTVSYRQLNYIYYWLQNLDEQSNLLSPLKNYAKKFCIQLENLGLIDNELSKGASKRKTFSLENTKDRKEYFGDVYCTKYLGSFASLAQAQRHRTLNYQIKVLEKQDFYVPKIIRKNEKLTNEWLCDMQKVKDLHPQGELIEIIERGTPEDFILKTKERLCTSAQLEVMEQTNFTLKKYMQNVEDEEIKNFLKQYDKGARCTCGFSCNSPCKFKEGINLEREI